MTYLGDIAEDATIVFMWSTNDADGASITRATDGTVSVYKDDGVAQSVAGVTDTEDFDSLTGVHMCKIDTSADAFYATGSDYAVVLSASTIDGQTVNAVLALFSVENRFIEADVTKIGGVVQSATDLKDLVDTGYDPITHKVQGVVLTDTATAVSNGVSLVDDAITASKYDESTAFPLTSADTGVTSVARTGTEDSVEITLDTINDKFDDTIDANVIQVGGVAQSATDLKDFVDTGYDPITHKVQGVVLTDTTTAVTNEVSADVVKISGDSDSADNLELMYDGTGYVDDTAPASRSQVSNLITTGAATNKSAGSVSVTTGSETGTYANTAALDGVYHQIDIAGDEIDLYYEFDIGATGVPVSVTFHGRLYDNPVADSMTVYAWDWENGPDWVQIGTLESTKGGDEIYLYTLFTNHVGSGADDGKVRIRFYDTNLNANTVLRIDQLYCSYATVGSTVGYASGSIWVDTVNGTAGTTNHVNGVADNPVKTWADALTLSASLKIKTFHIAPGSSIALSANSDNYAFYGWEWTLDLSGESLAAAYVQGAAVTGTMTGAGTRFFYCKMAQGGTATLSACGMKDCAIAGSIVLTSAGTYLLDGCFSGIAGTATPDIDFGSAVGDTALNMRHYSGGIEIKDMGDTGTDTMSLEGFGQLVINANCTGGTVAIRGTFTVTDNASGVVTLSDDARIDVDQIGDAVWDESIASHADSGTTGDALTTIDANVDSILTDTNTTIPDQITALNDLSAADVNAQCDTALSDYGANTVTPDAAGTAAGLHGTTDGLVNGLNDVSAAEVNTEVDTALSDIGLNKLDSMIEEESAGNKFTEAALQEAPSGTGGDATEAKQDTIIADITALNDLSAADVNAQCDSAIADAEPVDANIIQIGGVVQSATDLKDFADTGYDPVAHKVQGVLLADTTTTNTDMRGTDGANTVVPDTAAVITDAVWDETLTGATHNAATSAGRRLRELAGSVVHTGTAQGAGVNDNQIQLDAGASAVDGTYDPSLIAIVGGTGIGQCRLIYEYKGSTKTATVDRTWKVNPNATSEFVIYAHPGREHVNEGLSQGPGTGNNQIQLNALASASDDAYNRQLIFLRSGTGEDQVRVIYDYVGSTKMATVNRDWDVNPDTTTGYAVLPASTILTGDVFDANITQMGGVTQSATDLKDFADAGYDPVAHKVQGVLLVDTTTTNTDVRGTDGANTTVPDVAGTAATLHGTTDGKIDTVDGNVDSILEDTGDLQTNQGAWATATGFATSGALTTHDGKLDTAQGTLTKIEGMIVLDGAVYKYTTNALEEAPSGTGGDATAANQVLLLEDIVDMKGTAFAKNTNSLVNLSKSSEITTAQGTLTKIEGMLVLDGAVYKYTANALEEAPSSTGGDATLANQTSILEDLEDVKGTGFAKDTNSLVDLTATTPINVTVETTVVE